MEGNDILEQIQAHSKQLLALREKMKELQIPPTKMQELETQLNEVYALLYAE